MEITVKLFALLRETAGTDTLPLQVPQGAKVSQALEILQGQYPAFAPYIPRVRLALRQNFVDAATTLQAGDELALIPPVSGGF
jgi:molybdopterin converting factor subunit 1